MHRTRFSLRPYFTSIRPTLIQIREMRAAQMLLVDVTVAVAVLLSIASWILDDFCLGSKRVEKNKEEFVFSSKITVANGWSALTSGPSCIIAIKGIIWKPIRRLVMIQFGMFKLALGGCMRMWRRYGTCRYVWLRMAYSGQWRKRLSIKIASKYPIPWKIAHYQSNY